MTQPTPEPTLYDEIQDGRIGGLEGLVTPSYEQPEGIEHSFPVVGQGISSKQFQQMSLAQGSGVLITDDSESPYVLRNLPGGVAETNARNQMVLKVSQNTGRAEAIIAGFYHVLYEDMIIDLPPVTAATEYWVCLTYDPRREDEPAGPIRVEVHANELPRSHGRKHIILHEVYRTPNSLLSQAGIEMYRHYVSPTITSRGHWALPEPTDVNYGTLAVVRSETSGGNVVPGTGQIFESRGIHGWNNLLVGPWQDLAKYGGWDVSRGVWRYRLGMVDIVYRARSISTANSHRPFQLPLTLTQPYRGQYFHTGSEGSYSIEVATDGNGIFTHGRRHDGGWVDINLSIPDWFIAN